MRTYIKLLRLPYQLQLGPIFGWGYLLAGGHLSGGHLSAGVEISRFLIVFVAFHLGAFGGLTALNSFYDRDTGPIGGLWQPPLPPDRLWLFAWLVQLSGLLPLFWIDLRLVAVYSAILLLSVGYSHPRPRWKGHPAKSITTVALGQGVLDYLAGALTAEQAQWSSITWLGMVGATFTVIAFYPLTQLYQIQDDTERGDRTLAATLVQRHGRQGLFLWARILFACGMLCNAAALASATLLLDAGLLTLAAVVSLLILHKWSHAVAASREDFLHVHRFMRLNSLLFGIYILFKLFALG